MSFVVLKPGLLSSIQDLGRTGHRSLGINPTGAMDSTSIVLINTLLGNNENEAVLEMHFPAGEYIFETDCSFAIGGADFAPMLNNDAIDNWCTITAARGDALKFKEPRSGNRSYLAIAGGFAVPEWLGSKSTNLVATVGGFEGRALKAGDRIPLATPRIVNRRTLGPSLIPKYSRFPTVRVIAGGEFDLLTATSERSFLQQGFTVTTDSNRMGYRLKGEPLYPLDEKEMVSAAVTFGTIQLLPDGQLIVLMADHQTAGGYPRLANVISADLPLLAQLGSGDGVSFHLVSTEEAERLMTIFRRDLQFLMTGIKLNV